MTDLPKNNLKAKEGDLLKCILSKSPGYKKGNVYEVIKNEEGQLGLKADDGFFDLLSLLVSSFAKVSKPPVKNSNIKVVI